MFRFMSSWSYRDCNLRLLADLVGLCGVEGIDWGALTLFPFHLELQRKIVTLEARDAFIPSNRVCSRF